MRNRISFFIDGFNLYHALNDHKKYHKYKWLNLYKLAASLVSAKDQMAHVYYFTAYATWNPRKVKKHKDYVAALRCVGADVVLGKFKKKYKYCSHCGRKYETYEEKETDVNIATTLFESAYNDLWDSAVIISGDSDLIPAIKMIKNIFPAKNIGVMVPIGRSAIDIKNEADYLRKMKEMQLQKSQLDDVIRMNNGHKLRRPDNWK